MTTSSQQGQRSARGLGRREMLAAAAAAVAAPGVAAAKPVRSPAQAAGFDFLHGRWNVTHRKLRDRLAASQDWFEFPGTLDVAPIIGGLGNLDYNVLQDPAGSYEASSLRIFDPRADAWSVYWLDARAPALDPPVVGRFSGRKGDFFVEDVFRGRPIRVRTTYEPLSPTHAEWTQAFSPDGGASWEVNWVMDFRKA